MNKTFSRGTEIRCGPRGDFWESVKKWKILQQSKQMS